jgi:hypothetical protein
VDGISEIDTTARSLRDQAAELELLVNLTIDDSGESSARTSRARIAEHAVTHAGGRGRDVFAGKDSAGGTNACRLGGL